VISFGTLRTTADHYLELELSADLRQAMASKQTRPLDTRVYYSLASPTSRRLYRYLDYRRYGGDGGRTARSTVAFRLEQLAQELPIDRTHPSHIRQTLERAHDDLVAAGVVRSVVYEPRVPEGRRRPEWFVAYRLADPDVVALPARPAPRSPVVAVADRAPATTDGFGPGRLAILVQDILEVLHAERSVAFYTKAAKALGQEATYNVLGGVKQSIREGVPIDVARKIFTVTARRRAEDVGVAL
jgi:hypothetical protein